jgi:hypothetical protein
VTLTPETTAATLKAAIQQSIDTWEGLTIDGVVDHIHAAVHAALGPIVAQAVEQALNDPTSHAALTKIVLVPLLTDIEDELNDDHDSPGTDDAYRPGLRRAARLIRDTRRAATQDADETQP